MQKEICVCYTQEENMPYTEVETLKCLYLDICIVFSVTVIWYVDDQLGVPNFTFEWAWSILSSQQ